jgi:hypothetical protein
MVHIVQLYASGSARNSAVCLHLSSIIAAVLSRNRSREHRGNLAGVGVQNRFLKRDNHEAIGKRRDILANGCLQLSPISFAISWNDRKSDNDGCSSFDQSCLAELFERLVCGMI